MTRLLRLSLCALTLLVAGGGAPALAAAFGPRTCCARAARAPGKTCCAPSPDRPSALLPFAARVAAAAPASRSLLAAAVFAGRVRPAPVRFPSELSAGAVHARGPPFARG